MSFLKESFVSLCTIFLLIIPGIIFGKKKIVDDHQIRGLSKFLMNVVLPVVIINAMQLDFEAEYLFAILKILAATFIVFLLLCLLSKLLCRTLRLERHYFGLLSFCLFFANTGGIGLPIISSVFGKEAVLYASIVETGVDILLFTLGLFFMRLSSEKTPESILPENGVAQKPKFAFNPKNIISPCFVGIIIGLSLFLLDIKLPLVLTNAANKLGGANLPVAMFVIGYNVGKIRMHDMIGDIRIHIIVIIKMFFIPVLVFLLCRFVLRFDNVMTAVMTIMMAMPTGSAAVIFAEEYNADHIFASKCVILTTVLSVITIIPLTTLMLTYV